MKSPARHKVERVLWRVAFWTLLLWVGGLAVVFLTTPNIGPAAGSGDHVTYMDAVERWLATGKFYNDYQLAGPYTVVKLEILYPPTILPLLVVASMLPDVLWWAVPLGIIAGVVLYWRPKPLGWLLILLCLSVPATWEAMAYGNPVMWVAAFVALGTIWHWPSVFVLLKPTLAPFALVGIRHRSWWVALAVFVLVSLLFLPLWGQYVTVVLNARGPLVSPLYSAKDISLVFIPLVAWHWRLFHEGETQRTDLPDEPDREAVRTVARPRPLAIDAAGTGQGVVNGGRQDGIGR